MIFFVRHRLTPGRSAAPRGVAPEAPRWLLWLGVCLGVWLGYLLYADTLSLPFFEDDPIHLRWLSWHSLLDAFLTAEAVPTYRPLGLAIIKFWYYLLGYHDPVWLRFHNIAFHSLNVALTGVLAVRLDRGVWRYATGGVAAVLFAILPFGYQAIPWINNFFYPLNNLLLLLMALVYWEARRQESRPLLGLALFLCFLAPFEIEYGLMAGGLLFSLEVAWWLQGRVRAPWLGGPLLGVVMNTLFLLVWIWVPKNPYQYGMPTAERVFQISFYLLQGLVYPLAPLADVVMDRLGISDLAAIALVCLPGLALLVLWLVRRRQWGVLAAGLLWFALLNLPALLTLTFDYVINSPRLLYPPGPALAWLWAALFVGGLAAYRRRPFAAAVALLWLLLVAGQNVTFVRRLMGQYHLVERPVHQLAAIARAAPPDERLLVANMPAWLAPFDGDYALGNHGVQFIPGYLGIEDVIFAQNDRVQPTTAVQFDNVRQEQPYAYGLHGERVGWEQLVAHMQAAGRVYLTRYSPDAINLEYAGRVTGVAMGPVAAVFDEQLALSLVGVDEQADKLVVRLVWQVQRPVENGNVTAFVHLYGPDGQLMAQADGDPLLGLGPFWLWPAGQTIEDERTLSWPADAAPGTYRVGVGLYDRGSGARLPAVDEAGQPLADDVAVVWTVERP